MSGGDWGHPYTQAERIAGYGTENDPRFKKPDPQPPAPEASLEPDASIATISGAFRYAPGIHHPGCDSRAGKDCDCYLKSQLPAEQALHALAARLREAEEALQLALMDDQGDGLMPEQADRLDALLRSLAGKDAG